MKACAVLLFLASTAHAECPVTITTAPDDVRAAIESWAQREQVCNAPLEVRVVRTEAGLYLFAQDPRGRTRERVVPDAESVAVLVASWMVDDSVPVAPVVEMPAHGSIDPDTGAVRDDREPSRREERARVEPNRTGAITFAAMGGYDAQGGTTGLRAELELAHHGRWVVSAIGAVGTGHMMIAGTDTLPILDPTSTTDYRALLSVGPTFWFGAWSFRPALSVGLVARTAHVAASNSDGMEITRDGTAAAAGYELTFSLARSIGGSWSLLVEPMITVMSTHDGAIDTHGGLVFRDGIARPTAYDFALGLRRAI